MKRILLLLLIVLPILVNAESCRQLVVFDKTGQPSETKYATVMNHKAKVYKKDKTQMIETNQFVEFNDKYKIKGRTKKHFKLERNGDEIGYVKINDLFCGGGSPIKAESGLMKKFYVKTDVYNRDDKIPSYVNAYQSSTTTNCGKDGREFCNPLKRFNSYFIYKEENGRFLLATSNSFKGNRDYLTGWVDKSNGYIWKTMVGIRPSEKLSDEEPIYFYKNEQDTKNKSNGLPILGGYRWFNIPFRLPLLNIVRINGEEYYEVVLTTDIVTIKGFIEVTDKVVEDVFFLDSDFDKLSAIMNHLRFESTKSRDDARKDLALILKQSLGEVTGQSFLTNEENNRIDEFLNRGGIPTRKKSPLFKHRIKDLLDISDHSSIKDCNFRQLSNWLLVSKSMLKMVEKNKIPILKPIPVTGCDKEIPKYDQPIMSKSFPNDYSGYQYSEKQQRLRYLWVPKEYLP